MHSNKVAFTLVLGMLVSTTWAESSPEAQPATQIKTQTSTSEPQPEVRVEDIDAPILE